MRTNQVLLLSLFSLVILCNDTLAQGSKTIYAIPALRYDDIDGSPFMFKNWMAAEVIASSGEIYTEAKVNFNGYTNQIEYYKEEEIKEMRPGSYLKVSFETESGKYTFMRSLHPEFGTELVCILFDGQKVDLIKRLTVSVQEYNTPNKTINKFVQRTEYFMIVNGRVNQTNLKKKKVLAALKTDTSNLENYIEENDLGLKTEAEVIQLLNYYESDYN